MEEAEGACSVATEGTEISLTRSAISARLSRLMLDPEGARTMRTLTGSQPLNE